MLISGTPWGGSLQIRRAAAGGRRRGRETQPPIELKHHPVWAVIVGNLFAEDFILSVAHQLQVHTGVHLDHPALLRTQLSETSRPLERS